MRGGTSRNATIAGRAVVFACLLVLFVIPAAAGAADSTGQTGTTQQQVTETPGMPTPSTPSDPAATPTDKITVPVPKKPKKKKPAAKQPSSGGSGDSNKKTPSRDDGSRDDSNADAADPLGTADSPSNGPISVPNLFLRQFQIPPFLLPIYQAAGTEYGIRWEILAAINEIETNYGRNLNVSSAGALGWMQFMPATWEMYGTDANNDGVRDPFNPVDAIFSAARYLKAAGGDKDLQRGIFAYNHAQWYVDQVLLRAKVISGVPDGLVDSLTGLTQGHFPVFARASYSGAISKRSARRRAKAGTNAARVIEGQRRNGIKIYSRRGAPVVAVQDAVVSDIGANERDGRYITIEDTYGNRYKYSGLASISRLYPVPRNKKDIGRASVSSDGDLVNSEEDAGKKVRGPRLGTQERLYAHPDRPRAAANGSYGQLSASGVAMPGYETFDNYFSRPYGLKKEDVVLKPLREGAQVIGGTILGRIGSAGGRTPSVNFQVRPAGSGSPVIDPKPILDGWKLLESTAIYRAMGVNPLVPTGGGNQSIGQILLMSKEQLEQYVLNQGGIQIYSCGREDIQAGAIDRRVLAMLAFLDTEGYHPTVTSLTCGHGLYTSSGNVSEHSTGTAVDIAAINGEAMIANNKPGGLMEDTVKKIMTLQGVLEPHQIISLFEFGGSTFAMGDHADHIHVGFRPGYGINSSAKVRGSKRGQPRSIMRTRDWYRVFDHLGRIENPRVSTQPSPYAIKVKKKHGTRPGAND